MKEKRVEIHYNNMDIVQRLMGESMKGAVPLQVFGYDTCKVKEVLSTDLPDVKTINDKADTFYLLEDGNYLHVEYQSTWKKEDLYRFAEYSIRLYNKYIENSEIDNPTIKTFVIFSPSVKEEDIINKLDCGSLNLRFDYYRLKNNEEIKNESEKILDEIRGNPNITLSKEEKMKLVYYPLFNDEQHKIGEDAVYLVKGLNELTDEQEKAYLSSIVYVLVRRFLNEEIEEQIWEVIIQMSVVEKQFKNMVHNELRDRALAKLVDAIKKGKSNDVIETLMDFGNLSNEDLESAKKLAKQK